MPGVHCLFLDSAMLSFQVAAPTSVLSPRRTFAIDIKLQIGSTTTAMSGNWSPDWGTLQPYLVREDNACDPLWIPEQLVNVVVPDDLVVVPLLPHELAVGVSLLATRSMLRKDILS